jgi:uncharacterized protein (DUF1015 family)
MAVIKPFAALRYDFSKAGAPETVCCPPYDIIPDPAEWTKKSKHNAILLEGGERLGTPSPYADAKKTLDKWLQDGILYQDAAPAFYIYEASFTAQDGAARTLRGVAAILELSPFSEGVVLPHEFTLSKAKEDRRRLMTESGCQFSPIYGLYDDPEGVVSAVLAPALNAEPDCSFTMPDGVSHTLYTLTDPGVCDTVSEAFTDKKIFIADGHHRYETLLHLKNEADMTRYAMVFLADMNDTGVDVWATHRVVSNLEPYDEKAVLHSLEEGYTLSGGSDAAPDGSFVWITASGSYTLTPKSPWKENSAAAALHNGILEPVFGIDAANMAAGKNLTYTKYAEEAKELVAGGKAQCAFLLPKPSMSELRSTVLAGEKMPQKSTYFFPKIITGLFMRKF